MDLRQTFGAVVISGAGLATATSMFADEPDLIADLINANSAFQNAAADIVHEPIENPLPEGLYIEDDFILDAISAAEQNPAPRIHFIPTVGVPALSGYLDYMMDGQRGEFDVSSSLDLPREPDPNSTVAVSFAKYETILNEVNNRINAEPYLSDQDNFGRADVWSYIGDDCEDKSLKKFEALKEAGFPVDALRIAVGVVPEGGHAVLAVRTFDRGDVLLDNANPEIVSYDPDTTTGFRAIGVSSVENFMRLGTINPTSNPDPVIANVIAENERMYAPIDDTQPSVPLPRPRPKDFDI